jgi:hypothetical protein
MRLDIHLQNRSRAGDGWKRVEGMDEPEDTEVIDGGIGALEDSPAVAIVFILS